MDENEHSALPPLCRDWMKRAVTERATDLHLDPDGNRHRLTFRVDGLLRPAHSLDPGTGTKLLNQWKVAAHLGPDRPPGPQQGRISFLQDERHHAFRLTVVPTIEGEAAHLRRLRDAGEILSLEDLGLHARDVNALSDILRRPEGLILVSGPTGSGKTMTVYSLLSRLNRETLMAATIEDPVEYNLPHVRQLQVDEAHGVRFSDGLETLLRMDPDVVVIGEIRDAESANTAIRAAAAGRFVFASLHAPDVAGIVDSLAMLDVNPRRLATVLRFACGQKLCRLLCTECREQRDIEEQEAEWFESLNLEVPDRLYRPVGCDRCNGTGYKGRRGIFETLIPTPELTRVIATQGNTDALRTARSRLETPTLPRAALEAAAAGDTSFEEAVSLHTPPGMKEGTV